MVEWQTLYGLVCYYFEVKRRLSKVRIEWSAEFAYAIGLITTDGNLSPDGRHLNLTSKDEEMVVNFRTCLNLNNKIGRKSRGYDKAKKYFSLHFGDKNFYNFLLSIGLLPAKSKILDRLKIPEKFFSDFLRGCLDGDGTITISSHPESRYLQLRVRLSSASPKFLHWMKSEIRRILNIDGGYIEKKNRVLVLSFGKIDSLKILEFIYYDEVKYALTRKHNIFKKIKGEWRNRYTRTI